MGCSNIDSSEKARVKLIKAKNVFDILKDKYFLEIIFDNLSKEKTLAIIKYNKKIQRQLKITEKDYKDYFSLNSSIEIEITLANKINYNKFINIVNKKDEKYYHIYFNDSKEEVKRNCLNADDKVNKIKIKLDYQVKSLYKLFFNCECIESVNFITFERKDIRNMSYMFFGCSSLKEINFSNFNTNNVTNMSGMFNGCSSLKELNLSNFNTNKVTDMNDMFANCSSLNELNLSNFQTNKVKDMSFMFYKCSTLKILNISEFNIDKVESMGGMFWDCSEELKKEIKTKIKKLKNEAFN